MIEINLQEIDGTIHTYTAPTKREELRMKHFCGYLMILEQYQKEVKEIENDINEKELDVLGKKLKLGLCETRFQTKLVSLMLDVDYALLENQIGFKELNKISKEFQWMLELDFEQPSNDDLENLPEVLKLQVGEDSFELETDLDKISIGAMASIEDLLSTLATDYFKQFHYILSILILAKQGIYDLKETEKLGKRIWDEVYLSTTYPLIFFLQFGKTEYSLHTKVCSLLNTKTVGMEWMTKISETVSTGKK